MRNQLNSDDYIYDQKKIFLLWKYFKFCRKKYFFCCEKNGTFGSFEVNGTFGSSDQTDVMGLCADKVWSSNVPDCVSWLPNVPDWWSPNVPDLLVILKCPRLRQLTPKCLDWWSPNVPDSLRLVILKCPRLAGDPQMSQTCWWSSNVPDLYQLTSMIIVLIGMSNWRNMKVGTDFRSS